MPPDATRFSKNQAVEDSFSESHDIRVERREKPRLVAPSLALVRGIDADEQNFTDYTILDNVSRGGLFLRLNRCVEPGTRLLVLLHFGEAEAPTLRVALHAVVRRVEWQPDRRCGLALALQHYRFL